MNAIEGVGGVAEVLAWIVLMIGLPLLALGMVLRLKERGLVPTEIVIVVRQRERRARWFASGEIYERRLRAAERPRLAGQDVGLAYVSPTDPTTMRLQRRRPITSVCLSLGTTLAITGLCALVISLVPLFIP